MTPCGLSDRWYKPISSDYRTMAEMEHIVVFVNVLLVWCTCNGYIQCVPICRPNCICLINFQLSDLHPKLCYSITQWVMDPGRENLLQSWCTLISILLKKFQFRAMTREVTYWLLTIRNKPRGNRHEIYIALINFDDSGKFPSYR